eukprot:m.10795 g.10795  ORF g.10795 m.10795 type:complete len:254 (-) comp3858_c0_seq2:1143-1904(-)
MAVLWRVLLAVAIVTCCPHSSQAVTHIVQIVADDLGYQDIGLFNDGKTLTPYLNKMVSQEGMWLSDYYTFKICAPTRASLMTGRYPWSIGYYDMKEDPRHCVNQTYTMLPAALKELGYRTVALGKWDVGFVHRNCTPTERGFDTFLGYYSACTADYWYHGNPFGHVGTDFSDRCVRGLSVLHTSKATMSRTRDGEGEKTCEAKEQHKTERCRDRQDDKPAGSRSLLSRHEERGDFGSNNSIVLCPPGFKFNWQ